MLLFKFFTLYVILHSTTSASLDISPDEENSILTRALRDITGQYHPELHGDHAHEHKHEVPPTTLGVTYVPPPPSTGYTFPPPPPPTPPYGGTPNGYANCGCYPIGHCPKEVLIAMGQLLKNLKNDVVCGEREFELCCLDDPWPGQIDIFKPQVECRPVEHCTRVYGTLPTDVQDYGVIGPCLGFGSVRCLDGKPLPPPGPISIVVPIVDYNPPPPVIYQPPVVPPVVYEPPVVPPTVYEPPVVPPTVYEPPVVPPTVYEPPVVPPTVYEPPVVPPVVYEPPVVPPVVYEPPVVPTVVYEPPVVPPVVYEPPVVPPTVYEPPVVYTPPVAYVPPVVTYEAPVTVYEPPTTYEAPVTTYEAPVATYEPPIPATTYGAPEIDNGIGVSLPPRSSYLSRFHGYGGYRRYGFPYGRGGYGYNYGYPGFGFRKHIGFSKGIYG